MEHRGSYILEDNVMLENRKASFDNLNCTNFVLMSVYNIRELIYLL